MYSSFELDDLLLPLYIVVIWFYLVNTQKLGISISLLHYRHLGFLPWSGVQVVNLQAQLASLKAQAAQSYAAGTQDDFCNSLPPYQQQGQSCLPSGDDAKMMRTILSNQNVENNSSLQFYGSTMVDSDRVESSMEYDHSSNADVHLQFGGDDGSACVDVQINGRKSAYQDMDDLQSAALAYLRHS